MEFHVEQDFRGITVEEYEVLFFDEIFNDALGRSVNLTRELLQHEDTPEQIRREVRVRPDRQLPAPLAKLLGSAPLEYVEHVIYDRKAKTGTWEIRLNKLSGKIDARGRFAFTETEGGMHRQVHGQIRVKIFGLGGLAERYAVSDLEKSYARAGKFTQDWIEHHFAG